MVQRAATLPRNCIRSVAHCTLSKALKFCSLNARGCTAGVLERYLRMQSEKLPFDLSMNGFNLDRPHNAVQRSLHTPEK